MQLNWIGLNWIKVTYLTNSFMQVSALDMPRQVILNCLASHDVPCDKQKCHFTCKCENGCLQICDMFQKRIARKNLLMRVQKSLCEKDVFQLDVFCFRNSHLLCFHGNGNTTGWGVGESRRHTQRERETENWGFGRGRQGKSITTIRTVSALIKIIKKTSRSTAVRLTKANTDKEDKSPELSTTFAYPVMSTTVPLYNNRLSCVSLEMSGGNATHVLLQETRQMCVTHSQHQKEIYSLLKAE